MGRYITNINSYQDNELLLLRQGIAKNRKEFLTDGTDTWTIDHDVIVRVRVWGGGGGGGGGFFTSRSNGWISVPGGGGGAGGAAEAILRLSAGTYNITVGAGGAAGRGGHYGTSGLVNAGTSGGNGGSSSFHTYITCSGGLGGAIGSIGGGGLGKNGVGGVGGAASFNWSGFDGLLYVDSRFGGAGGSFKPGYYVRESAINDAGVMVTYGSEGGAGESGGPAGCSLTGSTALFFSYFRGGGGGGYNPPFIYGTNISAQVNSGRGVGAGGAGALGDQNTNSQGYVGNSGAVVIEWN